MWIELKNFFKDKNIFTKKYLSLPLASDLSHLNLKDLTKFLKSDLYIVLDQVNKKWFMWFFN